MYNLILYKLFFTTVIAFVTSIRWIKYNVN